MPHPCISYGCGVLLACSGKQYSHEQLQLSSACFPSHKIELISSNAPIHIHHLLDLASLYCPIWLVSGAGAKSNGRLRSLECVAVVLQGLSYLETALFFISLVKFGSKEMIKSMQG